MSDVCNCIDIKVEVMIDEPNIQGEADVSEVIFASDGQDYKRGYDDGHAQGLLDGQANGYDKGYNEGLSDGTKEEQEKSVVITENGTTDITPDDNKVLSKVTVEVDVADSFYDDFWDNFQQNGNRRDYSRAFMGAWWNDENYKPKYPMKPKESATNMYDNSNISDIGDVDFSECTSFGFQNSAIETLGVIDARVATSIQGLFSVCKKLISVGKLWCLPTHTFTTTFYGCSALNEIRFEPDTIGKNISFAQSSLLSTDSVESIINGLVDLTGQTSQTLTLHVNVKSNMSETQISEITSKNWTIASST